MIYIKADINGIIQVVSGVIGYIPNPSAIVSNVPNGFYNNIQKYLVVNGKLQLITYDVPTIGYCGEFNYEDKLIKCYHEATNQDNRNRTIYIGCLFLFFDANGNRLRDLDTRSYVIADMTPERAVVIPDTDITVPSFDLAYSSMQQPQPLLNMAWEAIQLAIYDKSLLNRLGL